MFWRLLCALAFAAKRAPEQDQWVPQAAVVDVLRRLVPAVHVGGVRRQSSSGVWRLVQRPVVPAAMVFSVHNFWAGEPVVPEVSQLMFEFDATLDSEPPAGMRNVGRPRGRVQRGHGRGGSVGGRRGRGRGALALTDETPIPGAELAAFQAARGNIAHQVRRPTGC